MENKELKKLNETGMYYLGIHKDYKGKVLKKSYFLDKSSILNTFGYYQEKNGSWTIFIIDCELGIIEEALNYKTEDGCIANLIIFAEDRNFWYQYQTGMADLEEKLSIISNYIMSEYGYSKTKTQKLLDSLMQTKTIVYEFLYYIENKEFINDRYATKYANYSVRNLSEKNKFSVLDAFAYMIYLKDKPREALKILHEEDK